MSEWKAWILRIVVSAVLGGLADALTKNSRQNSLVRLTAGTMMLCVMIAPLALLDPDSVRGFWERQAQSGAEAAEWGTEVQAAMTRDYTAAELAQWVEASAEASGIQCAAQVWLNEEMVPDRVIVILESESALQQMGAVVTAVAGGLGITRDRVELMIADDHIGQASDIIAGAPA